MDILNTLTQPFMLQAIFAGVLVASFLAVMGVFVTLKGKSFLADGIAHASLSGVAIGLVFWGQPLLMALLITIIMTVGITYFQKRSEIKIDSIIGVFYTIFFALGVVIINLSDSYQPELTRYLFGSLLFIDLTGLALISVVFLVTLYTIVINYNKLVYMTFDSESAFIRGIRVNMWDYLLNILTGVAIIVSIKLVGIVLVSGLLIIPPTTAKLVVKEFRQMIPWSVCFSLISLIIGILGSYYLEVPSGAAIVLASGVIFLGAYIFSQLHK